MNGSNISGVLLDLSGTLYSGDERIEGTRKCLAALRERNIAFRFLTNTTTKSLEEIAAKLDALEIEVEIDWILTPLAAARERLMVDGFKTAALFMANPVKKDLGDIIETEDDPDVVIMGDLSDQFDYATLNRAFRLLAKGSAFYALAKNRCFESGGELSLDLGPFIEALSYASRKEPVCLGKPSPGFFQHAIKELNLPPENIAVIGDDLETDVLGAMDCGLKGILVRTGKYNEELLRNSPRSPDAVIDSIEELPSLLFAGST